MDTVYSDASSSFRPMVTRFDEEKASEFLAKQDWVGLEDFLLTFLSSNHQDDGHYLHPHPGLFFIVYQGRLLEMIERKEFESAMTLFSDKLEPLLLRDNYSLYRPLDLEDRIGNLRTCVTNRMLPPQGVPSKTAIKMALFDYIYLYFPETIRPQGEEWANSLFEFAMVVLEVQDSKTEEKNIQYLKRERYRCLACQWMVPWCESLCSLECHIKGDSIDSRPCPSVTIYMLKRLEEVERVNEAMSDVETLAPSSVKKSKRRKTGRFIKKSKKSKAGQSPSEEELSPIPIPINPAALLPIVKKQSNTTVSLLHLLTITVPMASKVAEIINQEETLIMELRCMCFKAMTSKVAALSMDARCVFRIAHNLRSTSGLMFPLLLSLPYAVCQQVSEQEKLMSELTSQCLAAAEAVASKAWMASNSESCVGSNSTI